MTIIISEFWLWVFAVLFVAQVIVNIFVIYWKRKVAKATDRFHELMMAGKLYD